MKKLRNHYLLYDRDCPMCSAYAQAFVRYRLLDKQGRLSYQDMSPEIMELVDINRARNEIALVDMRSGTVLYGTDSLLKIIGIRFPLLQKLFNLAPLRWLLKYCYSFISYNRKVIMPKADAEGCRPCVPDFKMAYRLAYLLFAWLVTSFILSSYSGLLTGLVPPSNIYREFIICGGQILFQAIVISFIRPQLRMEYLGNLMTISLAGALLLSPALLVSHFTPDIPPLLYLAYFMLVVGLMFLEHIRRCNILKLGKMPSISWVLYRLIILTIIL